MMRLTRGTECEPCFGRKDEKDRRGTMACICLWHLLTRG